MAETKTKDEDEEQEKQAPPTNEKRATREPTEMHRRLASYIQDQTGYEPDVKTVQLVCNMRNEWRRTNEYKQFKAEQAQKAEENGGRKRRRKKSKKSDDSSSEEEETVSAGDSDSSDEDPFD